MRWLKLKDVNCAVPLVAINKIQMDLLYVTEASASAASTLDRASQLVG
jgi:hypothetical protein